MFQPLQADGELVGFEKRTESFVMFFGTRHCKRERLAQLYPHLRFSFLKQVHGKAVVRADSGMEPIADGHFSLERDVALVIQTADCLPILFAGNGLVLALHAGWRGLDLGIIATAKVASGANPLSIVAIGPHIGPGSFEVGLDVAEKFKGADFPHPNAEKKFVDLAKVAREQLAASFPRLQPEMVEGDTFTSPLFHSYRRGKDRGERQYSFVARI